MQIGFVIYKLQDTWSNTKEKLTLQLIQKAIEYSGVELHPDDNIITPNREFHIGIFFSDEMSELHFTGENILVECNHTQFDPQNTNMSRQH
jgi:hypothetical protein